MAASLFSFAPRSTGSNAGDVGAIHESPLRGVIVQFGGQTPLNLSRGLAAAGVPILGTSPDAIDLAEDRGRFGALLAELDIPCPANGIAHSLAAAKANARQIGYPVVVRPSYVLGGRAMAVVSAEAMLERYMVKAVAAAEGQPILVDHRMGFDLYATSGTAAFFHRAGIPASVLAKAVAGETAYTTLDAMREDKIHLIVNTPLGPESRDDGDRIRRLATRLDIPLITTLSAAQAAVNGIRALREKELRVRSLQTHHRT